MGKGRQNTGWTTKKWKALVVMELNPSVVGSGCLQLLLLVFLFLLLMACWPVTTDVMLKVQVPLATVSTQSLQLGFATEGASVLGMVTDLIFFTIF